MKIANAAVARWAYRKLKKIVGPTHPSSHSLALEFPSSSSLSSIPRQFSSHSPLFFPYMHFIPTSAAKTAKRIKSASPQSSTQWASWIKSFNSTFSGYRIIFYWRLSFAVSFYSTFSDTCSAKPKIISIDLMSLPVITPSLSRDSHTMSPRKASPKWLVAKSRKSNSISIKWRTKITYQKRISTTKFSK